MPYINTFTDTSEHYPSLIEKGEEYALQFNALVPFSAIKYVCPRMSAHGGTLKLKLFKWYNSYEKTVLGEILAIGEFDLANGTDMILTFDSMGEGEYLLVACDGSRGAGFCGLIDSFDGGRIYINGCPADGSMEAAVLFDYDADEYFGELSLDVTASRPVKVPPKQMLSIKHPINALNINPDEWQAIDGLGRRLPDYNEVGAKRRNKAVGLFYWDWHYHFDLSKPINVNNLMKEHPQLKNDYHNPLWDDKQADAYFWNEPIYGYYTSTDKYVIRRQAELLADAGVDFIVFDCTNGSYTWKLGYETLLETFSEARMDGIKTPQIVFMLNFGPFRSTHVMLRKIYTDIYRRERYKDLWYYHEGKPLVIAHKDIFETGRKLDNEILDFFTFRRNDPLYFTKEAPTSDSWGWLSINPQAKYGVREDGTFEQMTVGVAHNASEHGLVPMNDYRGGVYGRSHTTKEDYSYSYNCKGEYKTVNKETPNAHYYGLNFQEQWDYAISCDPDIIFVTGYNEWVAGRHEIWQNSPNAFPDQFIDEYSRDVEPTKGELKDYYYYQLAANIRRFKGVIPPAKKNINKTIDIKGDISIWDDIDGTNHYYNTAPKRDNNGWKGTHYTNNTSRNNIITSKAAYDDNYIYFYVKCQDKISSPEDKAWMRLFIATNYERPDWEGFNFVINRVSPGKNAILEASLGGWDWEKICEVEYNLDGDTLQIKVPRAMLDLDEKVSFCYKWSDNMQNDGDIMDFYVNGNVAPCARYTVKVEE